MFRWVWGVILLKQDLDSERGDGSAVECVPEPFPLLLSAYRALLLDVGECSANVCADLSTEMKSNLARIDEDLAKQPDPARIASTRKEVDRLLEVWGEDTARHYLNRSEEVKDLLLVMTRTAESLGLKDDRFAHQLLGVAAHMQTIATLDDVSRMRASLEDSARGLKTSVAQMSEEIKSVIEHLRVEVMTCQARLEKANHLVSCDALTGLGSRLWIESRIQQRIDAGSHFGVLMIDIVEFRQVNEQFGRMVGDVVLKDFARELRSSCRSSNLVARWRDDTFLVVSDAVEGTTKEEAERLRTWISRPYLIPGRPQNASVHLEAAIGYAEPREGDTVQAILERADAAINARPGPMLHRRTA
jgi:diguanylate cyclase (GGDEF)-like protein